MKFENKIKVLKELINNSNNIVFFGGAGVSTESGIPDFRSKDGLYNQKDVKFEKYSPEYLLSHSCLYNNPKVFYEFYRQKMDYRNIEPNITHKKLYKLEKSNKLSAIITQNIDGLHQKSGSKNVYEIHGTTKKVYCSSCKKNYDENYIFDCNDSIPKCECGGLIRPDITLYEEITPKEAWNNSVEVLSKADLLIIGGTSLTVYPAVNLINEYYRKNLVIINKDITNYDNNATLIFRENLGEVFSNI